MSQADARVSTGREQSLSAEDHAELLRLALRTHSSRVNAEEARAELHKAIRRAHRKGATIASIAVAAGLSTTRTHVIATKRKDNHE